MTTKELENKLKISENTCIHCPTEELAKQVLNILHQLNLKWCNETHYTVNPNWDSFKENTVYYPFEGEFTSLNYARLKGYKIINAEEFIALHKLKNNENMQENNDKEEDSQEFRVGDEVIDIITGRRGKIYPISAKDKKIIFSMYVDFNDRKEIYALDGSHYIDDKYPRLLHYRDDYDYNVIDFNNLPKRQDKRWRAKVGGKYYSFTSNFKVEESIEDNYYLDNEAYDSGNYFKTKEEAQEVADKLNKCFQELINPNK